MGSLVDDPLPEEALTICINFDSLDTFVGLAPILELVRNLAMPVNLLPLVLHNAEKKPIEEKDPLGAYKSRRAAARSQYAERELSRNCQRLGLTIEQGTRRFDATPGALGMLWLRGQGVSDAAMWQFVEAVFKAAYTSSASGDAEFIENLLSTQVNVFSDPSLAQQHHEQLNVLQQTLLDHGIFDSPAFWYQGELMQGRQHLPRLSWLLEGGAGPSPT